MGYNRFQAKILNLLHRHIFPFKFKRHGCNPPETLTLLFPIPPEMDGDPALSFGLSDLLTFFLPSQPLGLEPFEQSFRHTSRQSTILRPPFLKSGIEE